MALLQFEDVSLNFGGITALQEVSFKVPEGGIHALIATTEEVAS